MSELPTWVIWGQAIGGYAALIAAVAALIAAGITWKLRPLRMRAIERHSEELKEEIKEWSKQIQWPNDSRLGNIDPNRSPEDRILFQDLSEHLPSSVFETWYKYKSLMPQLAVMKSSLREEFDGWLDRTIGSQWWDSSPHGFRWDRSIQDLAWGDLVALARRQPLQWLNPSSLQQTIYQDGRLEWNGGGTVISSPGPDGESQAREALTMLANSIRESSSLIARFQQYTQSIKDAQDCVNVLRTLLDQYAFVPILENPSCSLLRLGIH